MDKKATELGKVSITKPAWRLMLDAAISIMDSIRESSVNLVVKGMTIVSIFTTGSVYAITTRAGIGDGVTTLGAGVIVLSIVIWCNE